MSAGNGSGPSRPRGRRLTRVLAFGLTAASLAAWLARRRALRAARERGDCVEVRTRMRALMEERS